MNDFASPRDIEASLKIHLMGQDVATPFVNVHQMPGKEAPIYVVTTESSLASLLQQFLEARTDAAARMHRAFSAACPRGQAVARLASPEPPLVGQPLM